MSSGAPGKSDFVRRAFFLTVADGAAKGATGILALILARFLGPADYGVFAAVTSLATLFIMVTNVGFEQEFLRRSAHEDVGQTLGLTFISIAITEVIAAAFVAGYIAVVRPAAPLPQLLVMAFAIYALARFHLPFRFLCLHLHRTEVPAAIQTLSTVILVAGTAAVLALHPSVEAVLALQIVVAALTLLAWELWRRGAGITAPVRTATPGVIGRFIQTSLPFGLTNLLWIAYFNLDVVILASLRTSEEVGVYSAVYRLIAMSYILGSAFSNSFTPSLFFAARTDARLHRSISMKMMRGLLAGGIVVTVAFFVGAPHLLRWTMGEAYSSGIRVAQLLSVAIVFRMVNFGLSEILTTSGRHGKRIAVEASVLAINVICNLLLVPRWGGEGAALATLAAEAAMTAAGLLLWSRRTARDSAPFAGEAPTI